MDFISLYHRSRAEKHAHLASHVQSWCRSRADRIELFVLPSADQVSIRAATRRPHNAIDLSAVALTMMGPDEDLTTLIRRKDHLNVLRYVRSHELREPELVVEHGRALLGPNLSRTLRDESARLAVLEQLCLACLDLQDHALSDVCLLQLKAAVGKESVRFRALLGRCLESAGDSAGAAAIYDDLLKDNPSNLVALKRKYCLLRAEAGRDVQAMEALNTYLQQNAADTAAWNEMAGYCLQLGDFKGAVYALEEVVLGYPLDSSLHCRLGEVYATIGGLENLQLARKHMAQSLELNDSNRRALFGVVSVASAFLEESVKQKKNVDEHDCEVAKELVNFGAEHLVNTYKGTKLQSAVQRYLMDKVGSANLA